jgi:outer membrane protein assembly factor BamB
MCLPLGATGRVAALVLLLSTAAGVAAQPPAWPHRGYDMANTGLSPFVVTHVGAPLWTFRCRRPAAPPPGPAGGGDGTVYIDRRDGQQRVGGQRDWRFGVDVPDGRPGAVGPTLSADGTTLYMGSSDFNVYAVPTAIVDRHAGVELRDGGRGVRLARPRHGWHVYVGSADFNVYALNGATGSQQWIARTHGAVVSSPAVGSDGSVYVGSNDWNLYVLDGARGTVFRTYTTGAWCARGSSPAFTTMTMT